MKPVARLKRPGLEQDLRIDAALKCGAVLRFTGSVFEECGRARGTGPTYPVLAVLRRVRVGRALVVVRGEGESFEIEVRAAPERSQEALRASLGARR